MSCLLCAFRGRCAAASAAASGPLYLVESPDTAALAGRADLSVWDSFTLNGTPFAIVSAPPRSKAQGLLAGASERTAFGARSYGIAPAAPGESLFVVTAPRGFRRSTLPPGVTVLLADAHTALVSADQPSADTLAAGGMELRAVAPPPSPAPAAAAVRSAARAGRITLSWEPHIQQIMDEVTEEGFTEMVGNLSGVNSVTIGGSPYTIQTRNSYQATPIEKATQYCYEYLEGKGLSTAYAPYSWNGYNWRNVAAEQPGTASPGNIYVVCAHVDDMPSSGTAPGADDNGSGSAAVLLAASVLSMRQFESTIRYVLFTGEEQGLIGSLYYVQDCIAAGDNILGAINLDMIAYEGDGQNTVEIHCGTIPASATLGDILIDTITTYSLDLIPQKITSGSVGASDHARFWNAGYPAVLGIEDTWVAPTNDFNPYYHSSNDTLANCDLFYATDYAKAAAGTLARLAVLVSPTRTPTPSPTPTPTPAWGRVDFQPEDAATAPGFYKDDGGEYGTYGDYGWR